MRFSFWGAVVSEIMCQLHGSTNKAEVLENMEFFRNAWEYHFDGAEMSHSNTVTYSSDVPHARVNSSIKKMLQLIWLVNGGRGQRTQGRSPTPHTMYFDTPLDMEPTQQVNPIAKNSVC